jgi:hypothetical protein
MSEKLPQQPQGEEVDLGQFFNLLAKGIKKIVDFISTIVIGIYKGFILLLAHIYNRAKWYGVALLLGLSIGYVIDSLAKPIYSAGLMIETNFGSTHQVYENLKYLNQLANIDKDSVELARKLEIPVSDAAKLTAFSINPDIDENDKIKLYSDFKKQLDSASLEELVYNDYIESLGFFSFSRHQILVSSTDKFIFQNLNDNLVSAITANNYLTDLKEVKKTNLKSKLETLNKQDEKIDSLASEYLKIRIKESEKELSTGSALGTNLFLGNAQQSNLLVDEAGLLTRKMTIEAERQQTQLDIVTNRDIVNVLARFPDAGYDISEWTDKKRFTLPLLFISITFIGFLVYGLGNFLESQKEIYKIK